MTVLFASKKLDTDKMELIQRVKDDYATGQRLVFDNNGANH